MKIITENRADMKRALLEIEPRLIMSFTQVDIAELYDLPLRVIINTKALPHQKIPEKWFGIATNNKVHSKIAVGVKGMILGSWNFSQNSTQNMHESVIQVLFEEAPGFQKQMTEYFDALWERSTKVK